jgi:steroid delta-isomerase-like uncharacterized protein
MSAEETAAVMHRYYELLNQPHDRSRYEVVAPNVIFREPGQLLEGRESLLQRLLAFHTALPDLRYTVDDMLVADDRAAVRWTVTGTHQGPLGPYSPTGKQVTMRGIAISRVANGQLVEAWGCLDTLSWMQQLGATVTLPGQAAQ